ncbi:hypothetical protein NC653_034931 [Populus alba x Populus x berolinensis]|uniref:Uncharacterized protein n=1 Tax=Populus alba x Populus x berolinensis TaxID=444605 RepID=A0AAD6PXP2_9ROSI|nr:hypothetical protein NC653_034931 [Populus alba x Populus x berolinensis]
MNTSKTGAGLYLSLLADALYRDGEDDDDGVMCWWNGCYSLCVFLLFLCFLVGCISLVALPTSPFVSFSFPFPLSPVLLSMLSLSILCSSIFLISLLVSFIYVTVKDGCLQSWLRRKLLLMLACMFSWLWELLMMLLLILTATNPRDGAHRWRKCY